MCSVLIDISSSLGQPSNLDMPRRFPGEGFCLRELVLLRVKFFDSEGKFACSCNFITGETVGEVKAVADIHQRKAEMARLSDAFCEKKEFPQSSGYALMNFVPH